MRDVVVFAVSRSAPSVLVGGVGACSENCVTLPGPSTQAWSVAWFIAMMPAPVMIFWSFSTLAGGRGPGSKSLRSARAGK